MRTEKRTRRVRAFQRRGHEGQTNEPGLNIDNGWSTGNGPFSHVHRDRAGCRFPASRIMEQRQRAAFTAELEAMRCLRPTKPWPPTHAALPWPTHAAPPTQQLTRAHTSPPTCAQSDNEEAPRGSSPNRPPTHMDRHSSTHILGQCHTPQNRPHSRCQWQPSTPLDPSTHPSRTHSLKYSLTYPRTHSLNHSLTHSLTHSLSHSLTPTTGAASPHVRSSQSRGPD